MRYTGAVLLVVAVLLGAVLPSMVAAGQQLDSVLGVQWGASPEQARQVMIANGYTFDGESTEFGSQLVWFKGPYAALPAHIKLYFMNRQMWQISAGIYEEEVGLEWAIDNLNKLLTEKYGPKSRDDSHDGWRSYNGENVPVTIYRWSLDGNSKEIKLWMYPTFYDSSKSKMGGKAEVVYMNIKLYDALKKNI